MSFPNNSYGAPYVNIYFEGPNGVIPLQVRLTEFKFSFTDSDGRTMSATIKSDVATLPDLPEYQEKAKWVVTWGYIQGKSITRTMYIRDIVPRYDTEGLTFTIKLKDLAHFMDKDGGRNTFEDQSALDIAKALADKNGLDGVKVDDGVNPPTIYGNNPLAEGVLPQPFTNQASSSSTYVYKPGAQGFVVQPSNVQANKSSTTLIKEALAKDIGGPYNLTSEEGYLIIRKLNLNKKPIKTYYYRHDDGNLISFTPETKNESHQKASAAMSTTVVDSLNKTFSNITVDQATDNTGDPSATTLGEAIVDPTTANQTPQPQSTGIGSKILSGANYVGNAINQASFDILNTVSFGAYKQIIGPSDNITKIQSSAGIAKTFTRTNTNVNYWDFGWKPATENTSTILGGPGIMDEVVQPNPQAPGPLDESLAALNNERRLRALEKNPGKAVVIGEPNLVEAQVVTFMGLAHKQSGNYYLCDVTHVIDVHRGYLCELSTLRNSNLLTGNDPQCLIKGKDFGVDSNLEVGPINSTTTPTTTIPTPTAAGLNPARVDIITMPGIMTDNGLLTDKSKIYYFPDEPDAYGRPGAHYKFDSTPILGAPNGSWSRKPGTP